MKYNLERYMFDRLIAVAVTIHGCTLFCQQQLLLVCVRPVFVYSALLICMCSVLCFISIANICMYLFSQFCVKIDKIMIFMKHSLNSATSSGLVFSVSDTSKSCVEFQLQHILLHRNKTAIRCLPWAPNTLKMHFQTGELTALTIDSKGRFPA